MWTLDFQDLELREEMGDVGGLTEHLESHVGGFYG
jgi:hypothetical protein